MTSKRLNTKMIQEDEGNRTLSSSFADYYATITSHPHIPVKIINNNNLNKQLTLLKLSQRIIKASDGVCLLGPSKQAIITHSKNKKANQFTNHFMLVM